MARTTTEADCAKILGVTQKTLYRYRCEPTQERPAVPHSMVGKRAFYDVDEVRRWMAQHAITGTRPGSVAPQPSMAPVVPDGAEHAAQAARVKGTQADAGAKLARARELNRQSKVREGLADTTAEADRLLSKAQTPEQLLEVDRLVAGLVLSGKVPIDVGRAFGERVTSMRQLMKASQKGEAGAGTLERATVATSEAIPLVHAFEGITDKARRQRVMAFVQAVAEEDRALGPRPDTGEPQADVA